ncbi:MAG: aldo/keto reductase [Dehalococcoidales bacterium]|nr:aldo/keto reductase [Dehalococcoidales bacterium]
MRKRKCGATDIELSVIGLGSWPMGGDHGGMSWGAQDDQASIDTIQHAMDKGINWIDTAPAYGRGHSEEVIGKAIKGSSVRPIIVTKCGSTWDKDNKATFELHEASVRTQCEASLQRMGIDTIDLYLVHWPFPLENMLEGWETCSKLVKEGKVRYIGVSNFTIEQMDQLQPIHPVAFMEPGYSMIERRIESEILPYCKEHNMGVIVYSPLQQGILTGAIKSADELDDIDFRRNNPHFTEPELSLNLKLVDGLRPIAQKHGRSVAQVALAWVLRKQEVTSALNGARAISEMEDSILAGDFELSDGEISTIDRLLDTRQKLLPPPPPPPAGGGPGGPPGAPGGGPPGRP